MTPDALIRVVARRAVDGLDACTPPDRAAVYRGLALILPTDGERSEASRIADEIETLERSQLSFLERLATQNPPPGKDGSRP